MMVMLVSFRRLAMVVAILPLGLIGVVMSLLLFNRPLGFVAILGILALIGMIAKNAVILIVQIETDRAEGKSVRDAVVPAPPTRLRPMMLTAMSTVLGPACRSRRRCSGVRWRLPSWAVCWWPRC